MQKGIFDNSIILCCQPAKDHRNSIPDEKEKEWKKPIFSSDDKNQQQALDEDLIRKRIEKRADSAPNMILIFFIFSGNNAISNVAEYRKYKYW